MLSDAFPLYLLLASLGDGCASRGHTLISDDRGANWRIGSADFGRPYFANECQAVELSNGDVLINARTITNRRVQVISHDGGLTFSDEELYVPEDLKQPLEGCEGSFVRDSVNDILYFSDPISTSVIRLNMTIMKSFDEGRSWKYHVTVDEGAVAYSSMQINPKNNQLELLYERSNIIQLVFEPDEIVYWQVSSSTLSAEH
jgi:sialidase-1